MTKVALETKRSPGLEQNIDTVMSSLSNVTVILYF